MKGPVIIDTGPFVAFLTRRARQYTWAREQFAVIAPPLLTCEAVISDACFLIQDVDQGTGPLLQLLERGVIVIDFNLAAELPAVSRLVKKYALVPMSLADACLVRMAELHTTSPVLTLDSDFRIYRKSGRTVIPTLMPK
jgi:predicted nucleic acid-binding protein